jgi:hypothetical protein
MTRESGKTQDDGALSEFFTLQQPILGKLSGIFTLRDFAQYRSIEFSRK